MERRKPTQTALPKRLRPSRALEPDLGNRRSAPGSRERFGARPSRYGAASKGPDAALAVALPLLIVYEFGVAALGGDAAVRNGLDAWIASGLTRLAPLAWPPWTASGILALGLLGWRLVDRRGAEFPIRWAWGIVGEGLLFGSALAALGTIAEPESLTGLGRRLVGLQVGPSAEAVASLGAGVFEEAVFRLLAIPILITLSRRLATPKPAAVLLAIAASSLAFSAAHHVGESPGAFDPDVFLYRTAAGVYFGALFLARGFGVAAAAHVSYDLIVGVIGPSV